MQCEAAALSLIEVPTQAEPHCQAEPIDEAPSHMRRYWRQAEGTLARASWAGTLLTEWQAPCEDSSLKSPSLNARARDAPGAH
jgi:hypothetical protein